ncbi:MAG TPA: hypothetical protein VD967_03415 [Candidatus Paceibacterota bacterium]|nr:hypothetical protein [Candidatus Paceibacterota bacterium]
MRTQARHRQRDLTDPPGGEEPESRDFAPDDDPEVNEGEGDRFS